MHGPGQREPLGLLAAKGNIPGVTSHIFRLGDPEIFHRHLPYFSEHSKIFLVTRVSMEVIVTS